VGLRFAFFFFPVITHSAIEKQMIKKLYQYNQAKCPKKQLRPVISQPRSYHISVRILLQGLTGCKLAAKIL
jgi:hypothetical protein